MNIREDAEQAKQTGGMVALLPADPAPLVVDGGEPAEDLHVTLAYLGEDVTDWPEGRAGRLADMLQAVADERDGPIEAAVGGHATFRPGTDEPITVHLITGDGLARLHQRVEQVLASTLGDDMPQQFSPWLPHVTGQYGADASALSYSGPVVFDRLALVLAGERIEIPLLPRAAQTDELARQAFAHGFACSGGPMTDRVRASARVALEYVREHGPTAEVLEATIQLGSLEGTWAKILHRREALYRDHGKTMADLWRALYSDMSDDLADTVTTWQHQPENADGGQHDRNTRRKAEAVAAMLLLLMRRADPTKAAYQSLVLAASAALDQARAEGWAGSVALAADQLGEPAINFDAAFTDALARLGDPGTSYGQAQRLVADVVRGVARDMAAALARYDEADTAPPEDIADALDRVLDAGRALEVELDWQMGKSFTQGVLDLLAAEGIDYVDFVTVGDDRVCVTCRDIEENNPYPRATVPEPAIHPFCRCTLIASSPWKGLRSLDLARYLVGGSS